MLGDLGGHCRLSHQSIRDLGFLKRLDGPELDGWPMVPAAPQAATHTDAADFRYGDMANGKDLLRGVSDV